MIKRIIEKELHQLLKEYPVVTIFGHRQAGKTTLAKLKQISNKVKFSWLVYNGDAMEFSDHKKTISFNQIEKIFTAEP